MRGASERKTAAPVRIHNAHRGARKPTGMRMTLETISEHRSFDGLQGFYRHDSQVIGTADALCRLSAAAGAAARGAGAVLPRRAHLHRRDLRHQGGRAAHRRAARPDAGHLRHQPAQHRHSRRGRRLGVRRRRGLLPECHPGALVALLPHVRLRARGAARDGARRTSRAMPSELGIFGHSMGGHGALVLALATRTSTARSPPSRRSARRPAARGAARRCRAISARTRPPGRATTRSSCSARAARRCLREILVDQGLADKFLPQGQLLPELLEQACASAGQPLRLRRHEGYGHDYYFIASFVEDHLRFHADALTAAPRS